MNTPEITTERLILRKFSEDDMDALLKIFSDDEVNRFLPWFPLKNLSEAEQFFQERFASVYQKSSGYAYAVCLKEDNVPIGYIHTDMSDTAHDFGYGLRKEYWHTGITSEAGQAVIEQLKRDGVDYITATHDRNNPNSGKVMQKLDMHYCYSYKEQWQPKNFPVIFRMYQLNFTAEETYVYREYWNRYKELCIEENM